MSIQVNNTDNQLNIITNGVLDVYNVKTIKSVSRAVDASGNHYIALNFIANDKNNSVRIPLSLVDSPVSWTNDTAGAIAAVEDLRDWLAEIVEVDINEANDSILVYGYDAAGGNNEAISVDSNGQVDTNVHDGSGTAITSTTVGADTGLDVNIIGGVTLDVNLDAANDEVGIYGYNGATPTKVYANANGQLGIQGAYQEDSAHASTNDGLFVMGVRNDSNTSMTSANGDYSPIAVNANGAVAINDGGNSITVDGGTGLLRTTGILRPTTSGNVNTAAATFYSVSVANVGAANGSVLGVAANIKPGEVLNFSADAINNYFNSFAYDATGTEFIIIYVS